MKKIAFLGAILLGLCVLSQNPKIIIKEIPLTIKTVTPTTWQDSTMITYTTESSNTGKAVGGAILGKLLFGGWGLVGGAIAGSSAEKTYETHTRWDKRTIRGYRVVVSDGYTFNTTNSSYKKGDKIKYK